MMHRLLQPPMILFGAGFTVAVALSLGCLLLGRLKVRLYREERYAIGFVLGSACLSALIFAFCALHLVYKPLLLATGIGILGLAWQSGALRPAGELLPPLARVWKYLFGTVFAVYFVLYLINAMAPEFSPDGSHYHLGMPLRYLEHHGFFLITWNMYASISHGIEMLFLFAFAFGRHSAAAMVHFAFLCVLPFLDAVLRTALRISRGRRLRRPICFCESDRRRGRHRCL